MVDRRSTRSGTSVSTSSQAEGNETLKVKKKLGNRSRAKMSPAVRRASKMDSLKPKKPPTAFFYFLDDFRKGFQEQNPNIKCMRDVGKACGIKWKTMTFEEKVKYYDIATQKRAEFETAIAEFERKMKDGDFDELEDDSDFDE